MEHIWTMLMHKILQNHLLCAFVANLKIDALYTESFCYKNLTIRKVFALCDSSSWRKIWIWHRMHLLQVCWRNMNQCRGQEYPSKSGKATVLLKLLGPKTLKIFHPENAQRSVKVQSNWLDLKTSMNQYGSRNMDRCDNICSLIWQCIVDFLHNFVFQIIIFQYLSKVWFIFLSNI